MPDSYLARILQGRRATKKRKTRLWEVGRKGLKEGLPSVFSCCHLLQVGSLKVRGETAQDVVRLSISVILQSRSAPIHGGRQGYAIHRDQLPEEVSFADIAVAGFLRISANPSKSAHCSC